MPIQTGNLQLDPMQPIDPLTSYAKVMGLRNMMQQGQVDQMRIQQAQMQMEKARRDEEAELAIRSALEKSGGKVEDAIPEIMKISPEIGMDLRKQIEQIRKAGFDADSAGIEMMTKRSQRIGMLANGVTDQETYKTAIIQATQEGLIDKETATQILASPYDASTVKYLQLQALTAQQALENVNREKTAAETERHNKAVEAKESTKEPTEFGEWLRQNPGKPLSEWFELKAKNKLTQEDKQSLQEELAALASKPNLTAEETKRKKAVEYALTLVATTYGPGWRQFEDKEGRIYFSHPSTGVTKPGPEGVVRPEIRTKMAEAQAEFATADAMLDEIEGMAKKVVTAQGWANVPSQYLGLKLGAISRYNPDATVYFSTKKAFGSMLTRAAGERGVLTEQDVNRIINALPSEGDTAEIANKKLNTLRRLYVSVKDARIKAYAGVALDKSKSEQTAPAQATGQKITATNPQTGQRIESTDGGKTWHPLQ